MDRVNADEYHCDALGQKFLGVWSPRFSGFFRLKVELRTLLMSMKHIHIRSSHFSYLFYGLLLIFLFGTFKVSVLGGWDQGFYWAQLTSIWYDGDLTLHNDLLTNWNFLRDQHRAITMLNPNGALPNTFSFGTTIVDGIYAGPIILLERLLGLPRMGNLLLTVVGLATLFKIFLLFLLTERLLGRMAPRSWRIHLTALLTFTGTPLVHYALVEYGMAHLNSALFALLFVLACLLWLTRPTINNGMLFGLIAGLLILIRWQNGVYVLFVLPPLIFQWIRVRRTQRTDYFIGTGIVVGIVIFVFSLQLMAWHKQFGVYWHVPQGEGYLSLQAPQWMPLLFSGYHALIPWSPVALIAFLGLLKGVMLRRGLWRWIMLGGILTVIATLYVNASVLDWWGGASYGARRFCCLFPIFALGIFEWLRTLPKILTISVGVLLILWMHVTFTCFQNRIDDLTVPVLGRQSVTAPVHQDPYWITAPSLARQVLRRKLPSFHYSAARLFRFDGYKTINRLISIAAMGGLFALAIFAGRGWPLRAGIQRGMLYIPLMYLGVLMSVLTMLPDSSRLNRTWKLYLKEQTTYQQAFEAGIPDEPLRLIAALRHIENQRLEDARNILFPVNPDDYRHVHWEEVRQLSGNTWR